MKRLFKTPKGTELPLMDIRGKEYLQVAYRLVWLREEHPDWGITTELLQVSEKSTLAKATIHNEKGTVIATAHKFETIQGFQDHTEKSETGAIGRALAMCGYGTQFTDDLNEGERLADAPVAPQRPKAALVSPLKPVSPLPEEPGLKPAGESTNKKREDLNRLLMKFYVPYLDKYPKTSFRGLLEGRYDGIPETKLLSVPQLQDLVTYMQTELKK